MHCHDQGTLFLGHSWNTKRDLQDQLDVKGFFVLEEGWIRGSRESRGAEMNGQTDKKMVPLHGAFFHLKPPLGTFKNAP